MRSDKITLLLEISFLVFCSFRSPAGWGKSFLSQVHREIMAERKRKKERENKSRHTVSDNLLVSTSLFQSYGHES